MKITDTIEITKNRKGELWSNIFGGWKQYFDDERRILYTMLKRKRSKYCSNELLTQDIERLQKQFQKKYGTDEEKEIAENEEQILIKKENTKNCIQQLMNFFTEFDFEPNFRFINTFARLDTVEKRKSYITNYFALTDNAYANAIAEKLESREFFDIANNEYFSTDKQINTRFKLYYGSQGTGKTTQAMNEAYNNVSVCHSAMLPSDLMEDFKFNNGKAAFTPSALCKAMTEGQTIVLDEINLLPFESLRFLQSILDGKSQIIYKGQIIEIKDGFKIIGTMNLQVNGMTYALPEPLVDRAEELKCFKLTAENLLNAIL